MPTLTQGLILLIGSGEMAPAMAAAHRTVMRRLPPPVRAAFLNTPGGFELNADAISGRAVEYFRSKLGVEMAVASFKSAADADDAVVHQAVTTLRQANYIFAGPGSPTYAIRNWRDTPILDALLEILAKGGCLAFASAAALTTGRLTIPVYEIYKVGEPVRWVEGLNILGRAGLDVAVVPHWNNQSGSDHDTSRCFMGQPRWNVLEAALPPMTAVLGINEHTACLLQIEEGIAVVQGKGAVTVRRGGAEHNFGKGETFSLDLLRTTEADSPPPRTSVADTPTPSTLQPAHVRVYDALSVLRTARELRDWNLMDQAENALRETLLELIAAMPSEPAPSAQSDAVPFVELLIDIRRDLRAAQQWTLADRIRSALGERGILLEDGEAGTRWRRSEDS